MNPTEIAEAIEDLALQPLDRAEFAFQFLRAFGSKDTAVQRLRGQYQPVRCAGRRVAAGQYLHRRRPVQHPLRH